MCRRTTLRSLRSVTCFPKGSFTCPECRLCCFGNPLASVWVMGRACLVGCTAYTLDLLDPLLRCLDGFFEYVFDEEESF
jgi:hypothetical protein